MEDRETYVVVGANLAGGRAAEGLRAAGFDGRILLIGAEPEPPYERPALSKEILKGTMEPEQLLLKQADAWESDGVELVLDTRVTRIRPSERSLELDSGATVRADKILLSTGGRVRRLTMPGAELEGVRYLRTLEDALAIREHLRPDAPVVVVGAGFVGAEVAASARQLGARVTVLEAAEVPLQRALGERMGRLYARYHRERGIDLRTGVSVERFEGDRRVRGVVTSGGERFDAECVVVGVGIEPATELAEQAGIATGNGILVDEYGRTSLENVYAAGDVACFPHAIIGGRVRLESWQNAQNQAVNTARTMLGERTPFVEVPWFWSDQFDLNLQMAGDTSAADDIVVRGSTEAARFSAFYLREGVLTGVLGVNRPRDVRAAMKHIHSGVRLDPAQLTDEQVDIRKLGVRAGSA
ncbi:FAD-dependent oxidoreductase [Streptomyces sp. NPDC004542]|uniref:NAD(P)/FAD-dependent oxidoreductase n=1 Tax=Streptomyces sp. NPDC004542 TaxID=3154281 RepID=UPI0033B9C3CC